MRAAPAVAVRGNGGPLWRALNGGLPALAAAAVVAWAALLLGLSAPVVPALSALAALTAGAMAIRCWRPGVALLQWDAQTWAADGVPGRLQLMMDAGFLLVLRLHLNDGGERWHAVSAAEAGPAWHALRAAVYSRPPRATPGCLSPERNAD